MILQEICEHKRLELAGRENETPLDQVRRNAESADPVRPVRFSAPMALIAEVKRRSPSKGPLAEGVDPATRARTYEAAGASAISVLADHKYFGGSLDDLQAVRKAVSIPILCKDFILTPYQVYEARAAGADLILLIVAALEDAELYELSALAASLGMAPLVEVHDQHDLARAIAADSALIGINNRNLADFSVDLVTTEYLAPLVPDAVTLVSESGIATRGDVERVADAGARVILVGETLMRSDNPGETIRELLR